MNKEKKIHYLCPSCKHQGICPYHDPKTISCAYYEKSVYLGGTET